MLVRPTMQHMQAAQQFDRPPAAPASEPFLTEMLQLAGDLTERAGLIADRLHRIDARVFGAAPCNDASDACKPVASGSASALRERLRDLSAILADTSAVVDRLDNIG